MMKFPTLLSSLLSLSLVYKVNATPGKGGNSQRKTCVVQASGTNTTDDAPAIRRAFKECGHGGIVEFKNTTYYVNTVMNITGLKDCTIDLKGTLVVRSLDQNISSRLY